MADRDQSQDPPLDSRSEPGGGEPRPAEGVVEGASRAPTASAAAIALAITTLLAACTPPREDPDLASQERSVLVRVCNSQVELWRDRQANRWWIRRHATLLTREERAEVDAAAAATVCGSAS